MRCDICGKFRADRDLVGMTGESIEGSRPEVWLECRFCCSLNDLKTYFGGTDV